MPSIQSAKSIPVSHADLLGAPQFAHVCTINVDGTPQTSPVWFNRDGDEILINSAEGRRKVDNIRRDPHVALSVMDASNPYRYIEIRGTVTEITHDGADAHIDQLAKAYMGVDLYPYHDPNVQRVMARIRVEHVVTLDP